MIKILNLFILLLFFNISFAQKKYKKNNFPKSTSAQERVSSNYSDLNNNGSLLQNINFRNIGPTVMSGRVVDLDVNPKDPANFYVAYASGGLWETKNHGNTFTPLFDNLMVMTIGDIKVDWNNNIIYVGTGEKIIQVDHPIQEMVYISHLIMVKIGLILVLMTHTILVEL